MVQRKVRQRKNKIIWQEEAQQKLENR
jgi:hypothetical protein